MGHWLDTSGTQVYDYKAASESVVDHKLLINPSQVSNNKTNNGYCDSKVANTDWLIPLVA